LAVYCLTTQHVLFDFREVIEKVIAVVITTLALCWFTNRLQLT